MHTSFLQFAVRYSIFQSESPVGFEHWFPVLSAEQHSDLLLELDASLCRHFTSRNLLCSALTLPEHSRELTVLSAKMLNLPERTENKSSEQASVQFRTHRAEQCGAMFAVRSH